MKKLLMIPALLLGALPVAAGEYVVLPNLYAKEFCEMRDFGLSYQDSMASAVEASMVRGTPTPVTYNGKETTSDVIRAARAVLERCPQHVE